VTGSSGHIGGAVAELLARDTRVIGLDRRPGPHTSHLGDVTDHRLVGELVRQAEAVVHTAALHVPDLGRAGEEAFHRVNVDATHHLIDAAVRHGIRRFVLLSTTSVYGCGARPGPPATWADEDVPPQPEDVYDRTKLEAEELCRRAAGAGMSTIVLRLARCFPETEALVAFYRMYRGVDRRDVADAHRLAVTVRLEGTATVNVAGPTPFRREDAASLWEAPWRVISRRCPGVREAFQRRGWPLPARIDRVYPIDRAREVLGYGPRFGVRELLGIATPS
jgi:UDP-glucose 4-epimerase